MRSKVKLFLFNRQLNMKEIKVDCDIIDSILLDNLIDLIDDLLEGVDTIEYTEVYNEN